MSKNIVVFDLEIKKTIEECSKGWASHDEMGISVLCAYDFRDKRYRVYMDDNIQEFVDRANEPGTLISGFNIVDFDLKVLRGAGYKIKPDDKLIIYDMLLESRMGALGKPRGAVKGFKLDDHLQALGLPMKTGNGALAPIWWKEGKVGKVVDYCMNDTIQETALFNWICDFSQLKCAYSPKSYKVRHPHELLPH